MNPLQQYPGARRWVYLAFWIVGLGLGGTQVGYAAAELGQPTWLTVALSVYAFVGAGVGYTAQTNVTPAATTGGGTLDPTREPDPDPEPAPSTPEADR